MTVACNTSPISNLAAIGQLPLLQQVYRSITIPQAVADEVAKVATIYAQAASVPLQSWITVQSVSDSTAVERLRGRKLDAGESEAIALALELNAELLIIDEQLGREVAVNEGLSITGLIGVLLEAKSKELNDSPQLFERDWFGKILCCACCQTFLEGAECGFYANVDSILYGIRVLSMRRSGMSQMTATRMYSTQANHEFTKASGIATA